MTSAAILAGGHARRLGGRDKTQLCVEGRTILARQCEALTACARRIFLVGYRGAPPEGAPIIAIPDRTADGGPLGGLDTALAAAGTDQVLLLACDMPYVTAALLEYVAGCPDDVDAVVPRTEHGYHPLCAVYAQSCRSPVANGLAQGRLRMTDLLAALRVRTIEGPELARFGDPTRLLANVNSQADLDAVEALKNH